MKYAKSSPQFNFLALPVYLLLGGTMCYLNNDSCLKVISALFVEELFMRKQNLWQLRISIWNPEWNKMTGNKASKYCVL